MTTIDIKGSKQIIGFLSMTIAWATLNISYSIHHAFRNGTVTESGVMIFWTGLFIVLSWLIFIIYPLGRLDSNRQLFKPTIFPFVTAIYGGIAFIILVGGIFRDLNLVLRFLHQSLFVGLIFGLVYSTLIRHQRFNSLIKKPVVKIFCVLTPLLLVTFFLWLLPTLFPSTMYRFMPDEIQDRIFVKTIKGFKVGDSFQDLDNKVPYKFNSTSSTFGSNYSGPLLDYSMEVRNDTIIKLDIVERK
jgi:hypothetical protein